MEGSGRNIGGGLCLLATVAAAPVGAIVKAYWFWRSRQHQVKIASFLSLWFLEVSKSFNFSVCVSTASHEEMNQVTSDVASCKGKKNYHPYKLY